ncbi:MAG TPA: ABC transporter permease [Anaerolineales bacterium]|nr:ABC transporter permease [Anaerolineales bacterium]HRF50175.1 ABC transporter permease [Anaerolineales bacterium]
MATITTSTPTEPAALGVIRKIASSFLLRRLAKALFSIWLVTSITFFVIRAMPGNAVDVLIQELTTQGVSPEDARNQAAALMNIDLDKPLPVQYLDYLGNVVRGDLGSSYKSAGLGVSDMIAQVLPWTLFSVGLALLITFVLGVALGAIMAYRRDTWIDHLLSNIAATLDAISPYLIGLLAILLFGITWKWVPIMEMRGAMSPGIKPAFTLEFLADIFMHVRVLLLVYVLSSIGSWMLQMKSNTVATLGEDYVTVARARGLTDGRILTAYVGRNATLPLFTRLAISVGFIVGGSVLLETLFTYRGVGFLLARSISERDYPVMQGVFLIITASVVVSNLLADYLYGWLDPRVRIAGGDN